MTLSRFSLVSTCWILLTATCLTPVISVTALDTDTPPPCQVQLNIVDYREQKEKTLFRELTLGVSLDIPDQVEGGINALQRHGASLRVTYLPPTHPSSLSPHHRRQRPQTIYEQPLSANELTEGLRMEVPAGPDQQVSYSYVEPVVGFEVAVVGLGRRGQVLCRSGVVKGDVLEERTKRVGAICARGADASAGDASAGTGVIPVDIQDRFLVQPGQQPFTLPELQLIQQAVTRAEKAYPPAPQAQAQNPIDPPPPPPVDESITDLATTVYQLKARALRVFRQSHEGQRYPYIGYDHHRQGDGVTDTSLAYLARMHTHYGPGRVWAMMPVYPLMALLTVVDAVVCGGDLNTVTPPMRAVDPWNEEVKLTGWEKVLGKTAFRHRIRNDRQWRP